MNNMARMIASAVPLWLRWVLGLGLLAPLVPTVSAGTVHLQLQNWESASTSFDGGDRVPREQFELGYERDWADWETRFLYRYEPIRYRVGEPASNSHLHQFRAETRHQGESWRVEAGLGAHGSSNRFAYQRYHEDMLVPEAAFLYGQPGDVVPQVGVAGDHRFGPFRLYPRIRWQGTAGDMQWLLDLPVAAAISGSRWNLGFYRVGDKWSVLDSDREIRTQVYRHEWQLRGEWDLWQHPRRDSALTLIAGSSFSTRLRYTDLEAGRRTDNLGQAGFVGVRVSY